MNELGGDGVEIPVQELFCRAPSWNRLRKNQFPSRERDLSG